MEFLNKGCGLRGLNKLLKKLLETGTTAIDEAATLKAYRISIIFLVCKICTQSLGCKFTQLQYCQILLKSVNIRPSNYKNKNGEVFLRHSVGVTELCLVLCVQYVYSC